MVGKFTVKCVDLEAAGLAHPSSLINHTLSKQYANILK